MEFSLAAEMGTLATEVVGNINAMAPHGFKILAAMVGLGLIPKVIYKFL